MFVLHVWVARGQGQDQGAFIVPLGQFVLHIAATTKTHSYRSALSRMAVVADTKQI